MGIMNFLDLRKSGNCFLQAVFGLVEVLSKGLNNPNGASGGLILQERWKVQAKERKVRAYSKAETEASAGEGNIRGRQPKSRYGNIKLGHYAQQNWRDYLNANISFNIWHSQVLFSQPVSSINTSYSWLNTGQKMEHISVAFFWIEALVTGVELPFVIKTLLPTLAISKITCTSALWGFTLSFITHPAN